MKKYNSLKEAEPDSKRPNVVRSSMTIWADTQLHFLNLFPPKSGKKDTAFCRLLRICVLFGDNRFFLAVCSACQCLCQMVINFGMKIGVC